MVILGLSDPAAGEAVGELIASYATYYDVMSCSTKWEMKFVVLIGIVT